MYTLNQPWTDLKTKSKTEKDISVQICCKEVEVVAALLLARCKQEIQGQNAISKPQNAADTVEIIEYLSDAVCNAKANP